MKRGAYYNENDPHAAAWLRELITAGVIADGDVDSRSIADVTPDDVEGYAQCHFFAGIGGWSYALRLAGWPDDGPVWTGSCPCQPFSSAGKGAGFSDERHLWPVWHPLILVCRPPVVFGEQVASAAGRAWFDLVSTDLEDLGYATGAADLCAAGVGAPHIRQRLYWVANTTGERHDGQHPLLREETVERPPSHLLEVTGGSFAGGMVNAVGQRGRGRESRSQNASDARFTGEVDFWSDADWLPCRDGKYRPVEPGTFPLAHGVPARVGRLRGYGNAIVPQVAAEFIAAYLEVR